MLLVADVGGTQTRLALARRTEPGWTLERLQVAPTRGDVTAVVRDYLAGIGAPALAGFGCCAAGPRREDGRIRLTNLAAELDPATLAAAAGVAHCVLVNDFEAVAQAIPALGPGELRQCGGRVPPPHAARLVLGAGTGLGVATLLPVADGWSVVPGEGGHADLAPVDDAELAAWTSLRVALGRVSVEHVLSGPGLARLHAALHPGDTRSAAQVAEAAWQGEPAARATIELFTRWLGRHAGNLALAAGARGGVYIAGGIVPGWGAKFDAQLFRSGFEDKAPFRDWLAAIPAFVVTHPQPGLLGLAELSAPALS